MLITGCSARIRWHRAASLALALLGLSGCFFTPMPEATSVGPSVDSIVIVGKIEIYPPINVASEQHVRGMGVQRLIQNKVVMATAPQPVRLDGSPGSVYQGNNVIHTTLGKVFILKAPRQRTFLNGAVIEMGQTVGTGQVRLPAKFVFNVPRGAKSIYIGTIYYKRNVFNEITSIQIRNEYGSGLRAYRAKFGSRAPVLTQSMLRRY